MHTEQLKRIPTSSQKMQLKTDLVTMVAADIWQLICWCGQASTTLFRLSGIAKVLDGMDAMTRQQLCVMPSGIPVATVGVNAARNAALIAAEILAVGDDELMAKLVKMREDMAEQVRQKDIALQEKIKEL